jgi:putative glutamine amidotransferase
MKKPLIGISTSYYSSANGMNTVRLNQAYVDAISLAGGIPVLIPSSITPEDLAELTERLDGLLLSGGGDISVGLFDGEDHPSISGVDPNRDTAELNLVRLFKETDKPIFGICRGVQAINVALGGSLNTNIPTQVDTTINHSNDAPEGVATRRSIVHSVDLQPGSKLSGIVGTTKLEVNSFHHQGVRKVAAGAVITGHAPDGTIESLEFPDHPFCIGVQWHPEWLTHQAETQQLFKAFVDSARK